MNKVKDYDKQAEKKKQNCWPVLQPGWIITRFMLRIKSKLRVKKKNDVKDDKID